MDNPKVQMRKTRRYGRAVFAKLNIKKGERIASFDGPIYNEWDSWTKEIADHSVQFAPKKWRDANGLARYINHSCEPNCGIKRKFHVVAMRNIKKGEEITWDYEMTENSNLWSLKCKCGKPSCRKKIGKFRNMPEEIRKKYKGFISSWLLKRSG